LAGAEEEQFELRLLSDPAFSEEFDIVVDEITDQYLTNDLPEDERQRVRQYFLSTPDRQKKLEFATALLRRAETERGRDVPEEDVRPGFFEQIAAFWRRQSFAQVAMTMAAVIIVAGVIYVLTRSNNKNYLALNLTISTAERAEGAAVQRVKLPADTGLRIALAIPEGARGAKGYVARLAGGSDLQIEQHTQEAVTVIIPAGSLTPGAYAIQLSKVKPDDTKERIPGNYYFAIE
jgi:hypothetical protein